MHACVYILLLLHALPEATPQAYSTLGSHLLNFELDMKELQIANYLDESYVDSSADWVHARPLAACS